MSAQVRNSRREALSSAPGRSVLGFLRELLPIALTLLAAAPLRSAVVDWNWVPTGSMKPTILEGDLVLVNKLAYDLKVPFSTAHLARWADPRRGDIVVFFSPADGERLVKRTVGLPGDVIEMRSDVLFVNGRALAYERADGSRFLDEIREDPHPVFAREELGPKAHWVMALPGRAALRSFGPFRVPAGEYFLMGDSRDNSADSRFFGAVRRNQIVGRASGVLVSVDLNRCLLPRLGRFASTLE